MTMMLRNRRPAWVRYGVAVALAAAALALKLLLVPILTEDEPFLLFFAAIIASAAFGGLGPGLLATAVASLIDNYFFVAPFNQFGFTNTGQQGRLVLFIAEGVFISIICARLKSSRQRADDSATEARELERQILEISDAEQRRIGHDLHDGLGQHLTGIALMVRRLEHHLAAVSSPDTGEAHRLSELTKTAVEWTHDLCRSLSPPVLESAGGLPEALRELAANAETIFNIECTFAQNGAALPAVDLASSVHLYRIAQEAISNAVRHGGARHVQIELRGTADAVAVRVADDGAGIETSKASEGEGMGLRIMRYRARMIGASIELTRRDGGGTLVSCVFNHDHA
jgi:signal transduction histidine kinase